MQVKRGILKEKEDGTIEVVVIVSKEDAATFLSMPIGEICTITQGYACDPVEKPPTQVAGVIGINDTKFGSEDKRVPLDQEMAALISDPHFQDFVSHMTKDPAPEDSLLAAANFVHGEVIRGAGEAMTREYTSWRAQKYGV